ncbi:hypothetical protein SK128_001209, partial [Halocaridina rubra]
MPHHEQSDCPVNTPAVIGLVNQDGVAKPHKDASRMSCYPPATYIPSTLSVTSSTLQSVIALCSSPHLTFHQLSHPICINISFLP